MIDTTPIDNELNARYCLADTRLLLQARDCYRALIEASKTALTTRIFDNFDSVAQSYANSMNACSVSHDEALNKLFSIGGN